MTAARNARDLIVVGGGVIGLAVAGASARRGLAVTVLERGRCGSGASQAAAGMLSPLGEALEPGPFLRFGLESLRAYPRFAAELEEETGVALELRRCGKLRVALSSDEEARLRGRLRWAKEQQLDVRWVERDEVFALEPALAGAVGGGLLLQNDLRVDNRALVRALEAAARRAGAEVREGAAVERILVQGSRVDGVSLEGGGTISGGAVLLAAGAWTGQVSGLPEPVPVRPVKGQMLALRPDTTPSDRVLESESVYLVPRDDGRVLVGATEEEVGFRPGATARGLRSLLSAALDLVPDLEPAPIRRVWDGFRPGSPDGLPILGPHPEVRDLYLATGHYRNGILLAPATARSMAALVAGDHAPLPPAEFRPDRFRSPVR